jgi:hypothetical protein
MALTANRKNLAVCEKASKAICHVYNVGKILEQIKDKKQTSGLDQSIIKKKRLLINPESSATHFISCDFCTENDRILVTLDNEHKIAIWQWDKQKCLAVEQL